MTDAQNNTSYSSPPEISLEELGRVAYMCYVLNRAWTTRWYHTWCTALEKMAGKGWTWEGIHYRGRIRDKLEELYGLTPRESRSAVAAYPLINMGLQPWQVLTDSVANELTEKVYRAYMGLPSEKGRDYWTMSDYAEGESVQDDDCDFSYGADTVVADDDPESDGGFYFI